MSPMLASPRPFGAEIQVLHVRLRGDLVASGLGVRPNSACAAPGPSHVKPRLERAGGEGNHRDTGPAGERVARAAGRKTNLSCY